MDDATLVAYVQNGLYKGKVLSFKEDSNRVVNLGNNGTWYPDIDLAGSTITISISSTSEKHGLKFYGSNVNGGTETNRGTINFKPTYTSSDVQDFRGFCPYNYDNRTITYSNVVFKWDDSITGGGMLVRTSEQNVILNNCLFDSNNSASGIGLYLNGNASNPKDITINNCTFTGGNREVAVDDVKRIDTIGITGETPDIYLEVSTQSATDVENFLSRVTFPAGSDPVVKIKSSQGYSDVTVVAPPAQYTISFDVLSSTITATEGQPVSLPALPVKEGYYAVGWAYNGTLVGYMFTVTDSNVVLTACYEPIPAGDGEPIVIPGSSQTVIEEASLGTDDIVVIAMCVLALLVLGFLFFIIKTS